MDRASILANFPGLAVARSPADVYFFFDDFLKADWSTSADVAGWNETLVTQAATGLTLLDPTDETPAESAGVLSIALTATADNGENLQGNGEAFNFEAGHPLYFECRCRNLDVSELDFFVGLAVTDAEIITGGVSDCIGFRMATGVLSALTEKDSTEKTTDCDITEADATWMKLAFFFDGKDSIVFYVDVGNGFEEVASRKLSTTADYVCDNMSMTPTVEAVTQTTTANVMYVDYVLVVQQR